MDGHVRERGRIHVERAADGWDTFDVVGTVGSNVAEYVDEVAPGDYRYRVRAFTGGVLSAYSNVDFVRVH